MLYQKTTFTLPVSSSSLSELEYALRVGKISEEEYRRITVELKNASANIKKGVAKASSK